MPRRNVFGLEAYAINKRCLTAMGVFATSTFSNCYPCPLGFIGCVHTIILHNFKQHRSSPLYSKGAPRSRNDHPTLLDQPTSHTTAVFDKETNRLNDIPLEEIVARWLIPAWPASCAWFTYLDFLTRLPDKGRVVQSVR